MVVDTPSIKIAKHNLNHNIQIMKKVLLNISLVAIAASLSLSSCKKSEEAEPDYSELTQQSSDNSSVQRESDQAIDDATTLLEGSSLGARLDAADTSLVVIDSSQTDSNSRRKFIFKYKNKFANGKTKSGKMTAVLTTGTNWKTAGSVLTLTFDTMKVVRNGKSVTFNGTKTITNVTGGRIKDLKTGSDAIVHNVLSSNLKVTFEDGSSKTWSVSKTRTFTVDENGLKVSVTGTGSQAGFTKLAEWGLTRKGTPFYASIEEPIVFSSCNQDPKPISGKKVHKGLTKEVVVTFGVDANGNLDNTCSAYGFKNNWLNRKGESQQTIVSY
jgi:hypothetical protein